jgi:hypothetical protein
MRVTILTLAPFIIININHYYTNNRCYFFGRFSAPGMMLLLYMDPDHSILATPKDMAIILFGTPF